MNNSPKTSPDLFRLDAQLAMVTGASRGLGRAIALGLAAQGANLLLLARDQTGLAETAAQAESSGVKAEIFNADLSQSGLLPEVFERATEKSGMPDILINCAGTTWRGPSEQMPLEEWRRVNAVNLDAPLILSQCLARALAGQPGRILNICSLLSEKARPTIAAYTVSKTGLLGLTRALAVEWAKLNITVNAIGPGYFETEMTATLKADPSFDAWVQERAPAGRWGQPQEVVGAAVFLVSPGAGFVTGQILYVDGGWTVAL